MSNKRIKVNSAWCYECYTKKGREIELKKIHNAGIWVCPTCNQRYTSTAISLLWQDWVDRLHKKPRP